MAKKALSSTYRQCENRVRSSILAVFERLDLCRRCGFGLDWHRMRLRRLQCRPGWFRMKYLLVANQTLAGQRLREKLRELEGEDTTVHLVVPATPVDISGQFVRTDTVENPGGSAAGVTTGGNAAGAGGTGRRRAQNRLREGLRLLSEEGIRATGEVGPSDPLEAIADALARADYDEIIVSTLPKGISRWLRMDLPRRAQRKFRLPVTHVEAST